MNYLRLRDVQQFGHFGPLARREVLFHLELLLQLEDLPTGEGCPRFLLSPTVATILVVLILLFQRFVGPVAVLFRSHHRSGRRWN